MADNDNSGLMLLGMGIIIGTIFTYIMLRKRGDAPVSQPQIQYIPHPCPPYPQLPALPATPPSNIISFVPVPSASCTPASVPGIQNEETWEIRKDKRGRLDTIKVHRQVKPST